MIESSPIVQMDSASDLKEAAPSYREPETHHLELPKRDLKTLEQSSPPAVSYDDQTSYFKPPDLSRASTMRSTRYPANIESAAGEIPLLERITLKDEPIQSNPQAEPAKSVHSNGSRFSEHLPRTPLQKKQANGVANGSLLGHELHRTMSEISRTNHRLGDDAPDPVIDPLPHGFFAKSPLSNVVIPEEDTAEPVQSRPDERNSIAAHRQQSLQAIYGTQQTPVRPASVNALANNETVNHSSQSLRETPAMNPSSLSLQSTIKFNTRPVSLRPSTARPYPASLRSRPLSSASRKKELPAIQSNLVKPSTLDIKLDSGIALASRSQADCFFAKCFKAVCPFRWPLG